MGQFNLNEKQKEAVEFTKGDLLIIAGAGTGKTSVLTKRIINLLNKDLAKSSEILALTFTEKASNEMQERIDDAMSYGYDEVWVSTFHAFCDRILRKDGYHIGLDGDYAMMTSAQSYIFMRKHIFDMSLKKFRPLGNPTRFINDLLKHFSRLQDEDVSPDEYIEFAKALPKGTVEEKESYGEAKELALVYKEYAELKVKESKIDFGDLIILVLKLFREEDTKSMLPNNLKVNVMKKISYSQINVYEACPRKYEYSYILRVPQRPSSALSFGSSVHNALKEFYDEHKMFKEGLGLTPAPTKEDLVALLEKKWIGVGYDSSVHEKKRKEAGIKIMEDYYDTFYSEDERPYMLEEGFTVHIGETTFSGKIDRMDLVNVTDDGVKEVEILDYKTGKVKKPADIKKDLQLPLYAAFAEEKLGVKVVGAKYVFVEHCEVVDVDVSEKRREKAKELIPGFIENIEARNFTATPGFNCRFCDYNSVCPFAQ